jgi:hypothetical protein
MHEMVAQAGPAIRDAAIGEGEVEFAERGGEVYENEAVEEAYGGVSRNIRGADASLGDIAT